MIWDSDPYLSPFKDVIINRYKKMVVKHHDLTKKMNLLDFSNGYLYYGLNKTDSGDWIFREWAPNAIEIYLIGEFSNWKPVDKYKLTKISAGNWEGIFEKKLLHHKELYKLLVRWNGGEGERIPSYATRVVQDEDTKIFSAQVWDPPKPYKMKHKVPIIGDNLLIYEFHPGMVTEEEGIGTFEECRKKLLPRIAKGGYNAIQIMAVQEHPYYGSFGYHVSSFFGVSSRFGTPEDLKRLIDDAHGMGLRVFMDLIHSHSVSNVNEGLGLFDGSEDMYFLKGDRREHPAWGSLCFDYGKNQVLHFLLSNIKYWMEVYRFDGFRFDGVTSMIYFNHGLEKDFLSYHDYFGGGEDEDALTYLMLANQLVHYIDRDATTIAEEMSGYPGVAAPLTHGGIGFDYRLAMGVPDYWIKLIKEKSDEQWQVSNMRWELTNRRAEEKVVNYAESHDQAMVGDKTIIFRLMDKEMYWHMGRESKNIIVDRGMALHKMIRLFTLSLSNGGYLNFMGNEFGHPEWIDFPRKGNNWSYKYARRQWHLADNRELRYGQLQQFDHDMIHIVNKTVNLIEDDLFVLSERDDDHVLVFVRRETIFAYNFHPVKSFERYAIPVPSGEYAIVLNSDDEAYGGFSRVDDKMSYFTFKENGKDMLYLYLPSRTALVLIKREKSKW